MRGAAGFAEGFDLVVQGTPVAIEYVFAGDDDVDFCSAVIHAGLDFFDFLWERVESGGKARRDGRDGNAGTLQRLDGGGHKVMIDAHRTGVKRLAVAYVFKQFLTHGLSCLGAQPSHGAGGIVAGEGCEIDGFDGVDQPCSLVFLFYRAAGGHGAGAALDGTAVDAHILDWAEVEFGAGVTVTVLVNVDGLDREQGYLCHSGLYRVKLRKYYTLGLSTRPATFLTSRRDLRVRSWQSRK